MIEQTHIFFEGTVQGIGFRFTVERFAKDLGLTGWVRNLSDGRVEILVEGEKALISQLIDRVEERFQGYIDQKHAQKLMASGKFTDFRITR